MNSSPPPIVTDTSALTKSLTALGVAVQPWVDLDLNRVATEMSRETLKKQGIQYPNVGFTWNGADTNTTTWIPQGITGLRNAPGQPERKFIVVSWYGASGNIDKGVRLSFVDVTDMSKIRYRHVLLVEKSDDASVFKRIKIHAGGLATLGDVLYVADTEAGIRAFDTRNIFSAEADLPGKARCGVINGKAYAYDYRYILPQTALYTLKQSQGGDTRFSYASIDWTDPAAPVLLTGNYHAPGEKYSNPPARVVWWDLAGSSIVGFRAQKETSQQRVQGAVSLNGTLWLSQSGESPKLWRMASGQGAVSFSWPAGCEDLHYSRYSKNLWCHTEKLGANRFVFAVKLADYAQ